MTIYYMNILSVGQAKKDINLYIYIHRNFPSTICDKVLILLCEYSSDKEHLLKNFLSVCPSVRRQRKYEKFKVS